MKLEVDDAASPATHCSEGRSDWFPQPSHIDMESLKASSESPATKTSSPFPIQESQLRHIVRTEASFEVLVFPILDAKTIAWRIVIRIPNHPRDLRLVDLSLKDRRWKQLNALVRFVLRSCGDSRTVVVDLAGIKPERLLTRGE